MLRLAWLVPILLALSAVAQAADGLELDRLAVSGTNATGQCGPARVEIQGMQTDTSGEPGTYIGPDGAVLILSGKASLTIGGASTSGVYLQDRNTLHCLSTPMGPRLLLVSHCFARQCAPVDHRVFDAATTKIVSRQNTMEECDQACAETALGVKLTEMLRKFPN